MVYSPRIGPDGKFPKDWHDLHRRLYSLETRPAGNIVIRETLKTTDPTTGEETIFGQLPDGSYGVQPFVGDTTPPPVPTTPVVSAQPGLITVGWDGNFVGGATRPRDFEHIIVQGHKMDGDTTVSTKIVGAIRMELQSVFISTDVIAIDEEYQFSFESVDFNGNTSARSARSATVIMESIMSDRKINEALEDLADEQQDLHDRADQTQADLADAQAIADALLAKGVNLATNGDFDMPIKAGKPITGWPTKILSYVEPASATGNTARSGDNILRAAPTATTAYAYTDWVTSAKDRIFTAEMWVKLATPVTDPAGTLGFYFTSLKLDGSTNVSPQFNTSGIDGASLTAGNLSTSTWTKLTVKYTVSVDSTKIRFGPRLTGSGNVYLVDNFKVMDITEAEAAQVSASQAYNTAVQAGLDAGTAGVAANSKNRNWYQDNPPAGINHKDGDTWFDTNDDNRIYVWNATAGPLGTGAWIDMRDKAIAAATMAASGAQTSADGKNTNHYGPSAPTGTKKNGDIWFDTVNGFRLNTWNASASAWQTTQDTAYALIETAKKGRTFTQATEPAVEFRNATTIWNDTSGTDGNMITKYWEPTLNAGAGGWRAVADRGIKVAQDSADAKAVVIYSNTTPAASANKPQNLWIDTTGGINIHKRWDATNGWTVVADSRIAATVISASAAGVSAQTAYDEAQKNRIFTGTVQPPLQFRNSTTTWIDTSLGDDKSVTKRWDTGTGAWVPVKDGGIDAAQLAAQTAAAIDATNKADAAYTAAINAQGFSKNPSFDDWTSTYPNLYGLYGTGSTIAKETTLVKRGANALRFNVPDAATQSGLTLGSGATADLPNLEFYTVELDFYLVSGTLAGAGVRIDFTGLTPTGAVPIYLASEVPGAVTGKWYRVSKVVQRPPSATGTWTNTRGFLMGNYDGFSGFTGAGAAKALVIDWFNVRPSTAEEILSFGTPAQLNTLSNSVSAVQTAANGKNRVIYNITNATGTTAPDGLPYLNGDTWFKRDTASPYNIIGQWEYQSGWQPRKIDGLTIANIDAGTITVGKLSGQSLSATAIDGMVITGSTIQTSVSATRGIKLTATELAGYDANDQKNFSLTTGGTLAIRGTIQSGSTISGATLSASGIYTNATPQRGVQIRDTGINAWDAGGTPTFVLNAATGEVEVPGLKAGSLKGTMLEAGTITANNLLITDFANLFENNDFELDTLAANPKGYFSNANCRVVAGGTNSSAQALEMDALNGTNNEVIGVAMYPVKPGDQYYFTFDYKFKNQNGTAGISVGFRRYSGSKGVQSYSAAGTTTTQSLTWASAGGFVYTIPAGTYFVRPQITYNNNLETTNDAYVDNVTVRRMNGGELIVDGAIDGKTITGPIIQTNNTPVSGSSARGIKLTPNELAGYDGVGTKNFSLGVDGSLTLKGDIQSGSTITGATVNGSTIQTSTLATKGVKINSQGVSAYNSTNGLTFKIDGTTGVVEAPGLKANTITGDMIAADTISVSNLAVTDLTNFAPSVGKEVNGETAPKDWLLTNGMTVVTSGADASGKRFNVFENTAEARAYGPYVAVSPGEHITAKATLYRAGGGTNSVYMRYYFYDSTKTLIPGGSGTQYIGAPQSVSSASSVDFVIKDAEVATGVAYVRLVFIVAIAGAGSGINTGFYNITGRRMQTGNLIVDGTIVGDHIKTGTVDAGVLVAASIKSEHLASDAVTAKVIAVGDFTNLAAGGAFDTVQDQANWTRGTGITWGTLNPAPGSIGYVNSVAGAGSRSLLLTSNPTVLPGEKYRIDFMYKTSSDYAGSGANAKLRIGNGADGSHQYSILYNTVNTTWTAASGVYTVPTTGVSTIKIEVVFDHTTGWINVDNLTIRRQTASVLIEDGAVTADHVRAGAIDASKIAAGSITASAIAAKTIGVDNLVISSTNNLLVESDFGNSGTSWQLNANRILMPTTGRGSSPAIRFTGTTSSNSMFNLPNKVAVDDDARFRVAIYVKTSTTLASNAVRIGVRPYNGNTVLSTQQIFGNTSTSGKDNYIPNTNVWTQIRGYSSALPAGTTHVEFYLAVTAPATGTIVDIDSVSVTRAADGNMIVDGSVTAKTLDANIVLATNIIAGDVNGTHAAMEPTGFRVYAADPSDSIPKEVASLGVAGSDDYLSISTVGGSKVSTISPEGVGSFAQVNIDGYDSSLPTNKKWGLWYGGREFSEVINSLPRGIVAAAYRDTASATNADSSTQANIAFLRLEVDIKAYRVYKIWTSPLRFSRTGGSVLTGIKYNTTGLATLSSGSLTEHYMYDELNAPIHQELFAVSSDMTVSFLLWMGVVGGSAGFRPTIGAPARLVVEDIGPMNNQINNGILLDNQTVTGTGKNTYIRQYAATGWANYDGAGALWTGDANHMYQGLSPLAGVGNMKSIATFNSAQIVSDTSGSTINNMRVYMNFPHWHKNSGGTARIGTHGYTSTPTTYGGVTTQVTSTGWPRPGSRWVDLPAGASNVNWNNFKSGTLKGIALVGDGTTTTYGFADKPVIEISYTK